MSDNKYEDYKRRYNTLINKTRETPDLPNYLRAEMDESLWITITFLTESGIFPWETKKILELYDELSAEKQYKLRQAIQDGMGKLALIL